MASNINTLNLDETKPEAVAATTLSVRDNFANIKGNLDTARVEITDLQADSHTHTNKALLDTYAQVETDLADAVTKKHEHVNLALLETYTQTEIDIADAIAKEHTHVNLALLETYNQTEANLADSVNKKHEHVNLALLETYTQTEANLASAVSLKHSHANSAVLDAITASYTTAEESKLLGIETGATADQTDTEIKTAYENNADTNAYTDSEKTKLAGLESSHFKGSYISLAALQTAHPTAAEGDYADVDTGVGSDVLRYIWDNNDTAWIEQLGASAALTDAQIKTQYENNADTNAFTDTLLGKLNGIEATAEVNNISDTDATDLTDTGDSTLHYHAADRARAVHTGTQVMATVSDAGGAATLDVGTAAGTVAAGDHTHPSSAGFPPLLHIQDQKASDTHAGANISGQQTRDLNTVLTNEISGASLNSGTAEITLPAGTYEILADAPAYDCGRNRTYLYNVTDTAYELTGLSSWTSSADAVQIRVPIRGRFTITATKVFTIEHYTGVVSSLGLGLAMLDDSEIEIYTDVKIWQL